MEVFFPFTRNSYSMLICQPLWRQFKEVDTMACSLARDCECLSRNYYLLWWSEVKVNYLSRNYYLLWWSAVKVNYCAQSLVIYLQSLILTRGAGYRSRYRDLLWAELSGVRIPVWAIFSLRFRSALGSTQPPVKWVPGLFPESKAAGAWIWPPTPC